jgi:hypothetical protein
MIDKLDLMTDPGIAIRNAISDRITWVRARSESIYAETAYVPINGVDVRLYRDGLRSRNKTVPDNKIEIHKVHRLSARQIVNVIEGIFEIDALELRLSRVDFTADVRGYSVDWFRVNCSVKYAQLFNLVGFKSGSTQTLYYGKRPNSICVYDKELEQAKTGIHTSGSATMDPGSDIWSADGESKILTRVERRAAGSKLARHFTTLGDLLNGAHLFDPFTSVELKPMGSVPTPESCNGPFLKAYGARQLMVDLGRQVARARINKGTGGKFAQVERQSRALRSSAELIPDLAAIYQRSVRMQLIPSRPENEDEHAPIAA